MLPPSGLAKRFAVLVRKAGVSAATLVLVSSCDRATSLELAPIQLAAECEALRLTPSVANSCGWTSWQESPHEQHFASETGASAAPSDPVWSGQSFSMYEAAARFCPQMVQNPEFAVFADGRKIVFKTVGTAVRIAPMPPSVTGAPRASYSPPYGVHKDTRLEYEASGGELVGECNVWSVRYTPTGTQIIGGWMTWTYLPANLYKLQSGGGGPGGGGFGGWAFSDGLLSVENGAPSGWEIALGTWFTGGGCTPGWDIYVNGAKVCDGNEVL